ncbi:hypothetical protein AAE250_16390 [Bacteroides sp. GD17]|jgi:hypothetical protein|uniref:hypothetical protein n=1 Tax=Bacteroides sp. GD17 TaxID=3139826 RepID=UPI00313F1168
MIETIQLSEVEKNLPVGDAAKLRGLNSAGNGVLMDPANLPHPNMGSGIVSGSVYNGKWYRIAIGAIGNYPSSGLFNIANVFYNESPRAIIVYAFTEGYGSGSTIVKMASSPIAPINKARVVYAQSQSLISYLDVYVRIPGETRFIISASCLIEFKLQKPEEVNEAIPEGYSAKEFTF